MGGVKNTLPPELQRQVAKVILLGASNVSLSEFIEEVKKFVKMFEEWEKNGE